MSKLTEKRIVTVAVILATLLFLLSMGTSIILYSRLQTLAKLSQDVEAVRTNLISIGDKLNDLNARVDVLQKSLKPFTLQGVASWYGQPFHGRVTASGEIYDMNGFTIAHRTLPLGTFVKLRNPTNGVEAIAVVNDRGPYVRGRDFDLSWALARKLKFERKGLQNLEVVVLAQLKGVSE